MIMSSQRKLFKEKFFVTVINAKKKITPHDKNSWSYVTIRELQARKHNQFSAIITSLAKDKIQKRRIFHDTRLSIGVFLKLKSVSRLLTFEKHKGHEISKKLSRKRWQVINFSPLSSQKKFESKCSRTQAFQQILHLIILKLTSPFQNSNTQTSFLKVSNNDRTRKLRKLTSL